MKLIAPIVALLAALLTAYGLGRRSAVDESRQNDQHPEHRSPVNQPLSDAAASDHFARADKMVPASSITTEDPVLLRQVDRLDAMYAAGKSLDHPCPEDDQLRCRTYRSALINGMPVICGHPKARSLTQAFAAQLEDDVLREWLQMCLESLDPRSPWHTYRRMQSDWYNRDQDYYRPDDLQIYEAIYNVARDETQKALALELFDELALKRWTDSVNHTVRGLGDPAVVRHAHPQDLATMSRWPE